MIVVASPRLHPFDFVVVEVDFLHTAGFKKHINEPLCRPSVVSRIILVIGVPNLLPVLAHRAHINANAVTVFCVFVIGSPILG
jgi:hypothetical protein